MKRKRTILGLLVLVIAAALLAVYYFYLGSTVPNGQPLVRLNSSNVGALKNAFNESSDSVRVIVMLSPT